MDIVPSIWLSSFAGAAFFYAGGRIWPRLRAPALEAGGPACEPDRAPDRALAEERARADALEQRLSAERATWARFEREADGELRALRAEAARLADEKNGLSAEKAALAEEKARIAGEKARIGAQAAEVAAQLAELRARGTTEIGKTRALVQAAEARAAEVEKKAAGSTAALKAKLDETTREISRARVEAAVESRKREASLAEELDRGKRELVAANARVKELAGRLTEAEARAADADRIGEENAGLRQAVAALERERAAAPNLAELQRRGVEATLRVHTVEHRAGELARKDDEIAELARQLEALSGAARDAEELRRRVRDLEAKTFAREAMESVPELPPSERWVEGEALETTLESALAEVVEHEGGCRTAVLSDARGLLIAGAGAGGCLEEIAAAAALSTMAADRLRELIPVGQPTSMAVLDDNGVVFRTRWLRYGEECFLLSTLGVRTRPLEPGADTLRARLTALVFG